MKKILFAVAAMAAITFASCGGNKTESAAVAADTVAAEQVDGTETLATALETSDPAQVQTAVESIQTKIQELIQSGDVQKAEEYKSQLVTWYNENKEKVEAITSGQMNISQIIETVKTLPTSVGGAVEGAAESAAEAAKADAQAAGEQVKAAGEQVKAAAEQKVQEQVNKAEQKAAEKVNEAAQKANEKVNEAAKKAVGGLLGK